MNFVIQGASADQILGGNPAEENRDGEVSFAASREDGDKVLGAVPHQNFPANLQKVFVGDEPEDDYLPEPKL